MRKGDYRLVRRIIYYYNIDTYFVKYNDNNKSLSSCQKSTQFICEIIIHRKNTWRAEVKLRAALQTNSVHINGLSVKKLNTYEFWAQLQTMVEIINCIIESLKIKLSYLQWVLLFWVHIFLNCIIVITVENPGLQLQC